MTASNRAAEPGFDLIFNVGSRRSGTYWLQRIVAAHPDVAEVPAETHLYSHGFAPLFERFQHEDPRDQTVGFSYLERERLLAAARELALASFAHARSGAEPVVAERTPFHVRHLPLIAEIHPEARFVHIIRDGRDVTRSLLLHEWGPKTVTEAATEWRESVGAGRGAGLGAGRYREVRYEQLRERPREQIVDLYGWLGLDCGEAALEAALEAAGERHNSAPGSGGEIGSGRWRDEWDEAELSEFESVAGELLAELGYA